MQENHTHGFPPPINDLVYSIPNYDRNYRTLSLYAPEDAGKHGSREAKKLQVLMADTDFASFASQRWGASERERKTNLHKASSDEIKTWMAEENLPGRILQEMQDMGLPRPNFAHYTGHGIHWFWSLSPNFGWNKADAIWSMDRLITAWKGVTAWWKDPACTQQITPILGSWRCKETPGAKGKAVEQLILPTDHGEWADEPLRRLFLRLEGSEGMAIDFDLPTTTRTSRKEAKNLRFSTIVNLPADHPCAADFRYVKSTSWDIVQLPSGEYVTEKKKGSMTSRSATVEKDGCLHVYDWTSNTQYIFGARQDGRTKAAKAKAKAKSKAKVSTAPDKFGLSDASYLQALTLIRATEKAQQVRAVHPDSIVIPELCDDADKLKEWREEAALSAKLHEERTGHAGGTWGARCAKSGRLCAVTAVNTPKGGVFHRRQMLCYSYICPDCGRWRLASIQSATLGWAMTWGAKKDTMADEALFLLNEDGRPNLIEADQTMCDDRFGRILLTDRETWDTGHGVQDKLRKWKAEANNREYLTIHPTPTQCVTICFYRGKDVPDFSTPSGSEWSWGGNLLKVLSAQLARIDLGSWVDYAESAKAAGKRVRVSLISSPRGGPEEAITILSNYLTGKKRGGKATSANPEGTQTKYTIVTTQSESVLQHASAPMQRACDPYEGGKGWIRFGEVIPMNVVEFLKGAVQAGLITHKIRVVKKAGEDGMFDLAM